MDRCMIILLGYNPWNIFNVQITHWFLEQTWFSFWCQRRDPKTGKIVVRSTCTYGGLRRDVFGLVWFISICLPWKTIIDFLFYSSTLLDHNSCLGQTFSLFLCDAFPLYRFTLPSLNAVNKQSERPTTIRIAQQFMDHLNLKFTNRGLPKSLFTKKIHFKSCFSNKREDKWWTGLRGLDHLKPLSP